jgi:hypothetical protein
MSATPRIHVLTLLAMTLAGGCAPSDRALKSYFFSTVDLNVIAKTAGAGDLVWGGGGSGSTGFHHRHFDGDFRCKPESMDRFLEALKVGLQEAVKQSGGQIARLDAVKEEPGISGFRLQYSQPAIQGDVRGDIRGRVRGKIRGQVQVLVGPAKKGPWLKEYPHTVTIEIDEQPEGEN